MAYTNFKTHLINKCGLSENEFLQVLPYISTMNVAKGEYLLQQGAVCSHFFFVEQGLLRMYTLNEEGKENILQFATENWIVSDRGSVYFKEPSSYFIDAVENTQVILLNDSFITQVTGINPDFRKKNEQLLHNHIRQLYKRIAQLLGASAKSRYLDFVSMYPNIMLRVPQWMIASYLGMTPESLSRVRKALAEENFKPNS